MSSKFPENIGIKNQMAVSYLMIGQGKVAAGLLEQVSNLFLPSMNSISAYEAAIIVDVLAIV